MAFVRLFEGKKWTAIVLDDDAQRALKEYASRCFPKMRGELVCHHCTLSFGDHIGKAGQKRILNVSARSSNGLVAAFKVEGADDSTNKIPHVTAIVDREKGGRPVMSNSLSDWTPCFFGPLHGTVKHLTE